jgi:hypothetical protein
MSLRWACRSARTGDEGTIPKTMSTSFAVANLLMDAPASGDGDSTTGEKTEAAATSQVEDAVKPQVRLRISSHY